MTRGDKGKPFILLFLYLLSLSQQDCVLPVVFPERELKEALRNTLTQAAL